MVIWHLSHRLQGTLKPFEIAVASNSYMPCAFFFLVFLVTGELSNLRQMMEVPDEPGLSPNNGLENAPLSDQSMASNPRKGQAKRSGTKTTSHVGKADQRLHLLIVWL